MKSKVPCPQCGSTNVVFHDGMLGYEAIRCFDCDTETDLNSGTTCPRGGKPIKRRIQPMPSDETDG